VTTHSARPAAPALPVHDGRDAAARSSGPGSGHYPGRARAWVVAVMATLAMTVSYVDRQVLAALAPTVKAALGIDHTQYGWLASAFAFAYLVGAPLGGAFVDRIGARRGLAATLVVWSIVAAAHALVPTFAALLVLRVLLGLAEGPSFPGAVQAARRVLAGRDRDAGVGMVFSGSSIGAMIAGPLAVAVHVRYGWRGAFVGVAAIGLAWLPVWIVATRGAVGALLAVPEPAAERVEAADATSASGLAGLGSLLGTQTVRRSILLVLVSAPAFLFGLTWFPLYLAGAHHVPQARMGAFVVVPPLLFDFGAFGLGALASRFRSARGPRAVIAAAAVLVTALAWVPAADAAGAGPWVATALAATALAGVGATYGVLTSDMLARVPPSFVSRAAGLAAAAQSLAHIVGGPLIGRVVDRHHGSYAEVLPALGLLVLPGAIAWILWPGVEPRRPG